MGPFEKHKDRFFHSTMYNMTRAINRLAELVEDAGGKVERHSGELLIHARGYDERIKRARESLERAELVAKHRGDGDGKHLIKAETAVENYRKQLQELEEKAQTAPVVKTNFVSLISDLWIRFELDGFRYEFEVENNPFFPDKWCKSPAAGEKRGYYWEEIEIGDKGYYVNDMFEPVADEKTIEDAAMWLLHFFQRQGPCEKCE